MIFSRVCRICGRELVDGERKICLHCMSAAPLWAGSRDDLRAHRLPRAAAIDGVWPWLSYSNSDPLCELIRKGKFNDSPELIEELSRRYGAWLMAEGRLDGVEALVPVPMHWWKRLLRGYNQAELIAEGISEASGIPVDNALRAVRGHAVQSRKKGAERTANVAGIFALRDGHGLEPGMRIAVVDDILTTGATLSEAVKVLSETSPGGITVLALAATRLD